MRKRYVGKTSGVITTIATAGQMTKADQEEHPEAGTVVRMTVRRLTKTSKMHFLTAFASLLNMPDIATAQLDGEGGVVTFRHRFTAREADRFYRAEF